MKGYRHESNLGQLELQQEVLKITWDNNPLNWEITEPYQWK